MKLRSRLVLSFTYILLIVIVALTIPLAINLTRRAESDLATDTLVTAQMLAAHIDGSDIKRPATLRRLLGGEQPQIERVVVTDTHGTVVYDSSGEATGQDFVNDARDEITSALAGDPTTAVRYSQTLGHDIMVAAVPIIDRNIVGVIRLTRDAGDLRHAERRTVMGLILIDVTALLAGILFAFGLAGSIARPIQRLADTARRLGGGDLSARAGTAGSTAEVKDLAESFDEMADRLQRTVNAQGEFVANASHQLRTPLTGMKLRLESAGDASTIDEARPQIEAAERETDRLSETVDRLLVIARGGKDRPSDVDLLDAGRRASQRWQERVGQARSSLTIEGRAIIVRADRNDVDQILDNLLANAVAHAPGPILVRTDGTDAWASIEVRDHGPGIPPEERDRVTERFYRGKQADAAGSGLGLAIARELAERWGASLTIGAGPDGGTAVAIRFPVGASSP